MAQRIFKYGLFWPSSKDPLSLEQDMVLQGGRWKKKQSDGFVGEGLFHHFKQCIMLCWPWVKWHAWADLQLKCYLEYRLVGTIGPASSGKTFLSAAMMLTDYYIFPWCTTILVSSTTRESLEMRILGEVKKLHRDAHDRFPWLPGNLIEGRQRIVTDARNVSSEGRDFRNGIVGVACKKGQSFQGIEEYVGIKNKRLRALADECFPAGTMVDTSNGPKPIETVRPGDVVMSADGPNRVLGASVRACRKLVFVRMKDGRKFRCTPKHKVLTQCGWVFACNLNQQHYILSPYEAMRVLRNPSPEQAFLQSVLQREVDAQPARYSASEVGKNIVFKEEMVVTPGFPPFRVLGENEVRQSNARPGSLSKIRRSEQSIRNQTYRARWKRNRAYQGGVAVAEDVPRGNLELPHKNIHEVRVGIPDLLQGGCGLSGTEDCHRGRRGIPQQPTPQGKGPEKGQTTQGAWVDSVAVYKQNDFGFQDPGGNTGSRRVYNLHVEGHPSYSVYGLTVHNCQFLPRVFIDSIANLNKNTDFKGIFLGNPKDVTDALGVICEPAAHLGGWDGGMDQQGGTKTWETRFPRGVCIQLVGTDSPNLDGNLGIPLITQKQIDDDIAFYGQDSLQFTMMDLGRMPRGQALRRVITRQMCLKFHAMEEPVWKDSNRIKIAFMDAAYRGVGGDRCVLGFLEFGEEAVGATAEEMVSAIVTQKVTQKSNNQILSLIETMLVPVSSNINEIPEDQIVNFVKEQCEKRNVPPENLYFDSTGRGSLMNAFGRLWPIPTGIEFGGQGSERKVSADIDVICKDYYSKYVTELWFNVSYTIQSGQFRGMTEEMMQEGCFREWGFVGAGRGMKIEVETKDKMKLKSGRSPDLFDALCCGVEGARRRGFIIKKQHAIQNKRVDRNWKLDLKKRAQEHWHGNQLNYSC